MAFGFAFCSTIIVIHIYAFSYISVIYTYTIHIYTYKCMHAYVDACPMIGCSWLFCRAEMFVSLLRKAALQKLFFQQLPWEASVNTQLLEAIFPYKARPTQLARKAGFKASVNVPRSQAWHDLCDGLGLYIYMEPVKRCSPIHEYCKVWLLSREPSPANRGRASSACAFVDWLFLACNAIGLQPQAPTKRDFNGSRDRSQ